MPASQPAYFHLQEFSDGGVLLLGGRLYTYAQGTTALKIAYTDPAGAVPQTYTADGLGGQYIGLNARGELPAPLYLAPGSYDIALKRVDGSTVWTRRADPTVDNVALAAATGTALISGTWFGGVVASIAALASEIGSSLIGFLQAGAGAVIRSAQDKLREKLSITDFYANGVNGPAVDPTGVLDSTIGIQNAVNRRGRVNIPAGTYLCSATITVPPNTILFGEGMSKSVLQFTNIGDGLVNSFPVNGSNDASVHMHDFSVVCTNGANAGGGIVQVCGSYFHIQRVLIQGFKYGPIFDQTEISSIKDCVIQFNTTGGVWLVNGADRSPGAAFRFTNRIIITGNQFNANPYHVINDGGTVHTIDGNNFNGGTVAMRVAGASAVSFINNEVENATVAGVLAANNTLKTGTGVSGPLGVRIETNNISVGVGAAAVSFVAGCSGFTLANNYLQSPAQPGFAVIGASSCQYLSSENNDFGGFAGVLDSYPTNFRQWDTNLKQDSYKTYYSPNRLNSAFAVHCPSNFGGSSPVGGIDFQAYNLANAKATYARIAPGLTDNTTGLEAGALVVQLAIAGVMTTAYSLKPSEFIPNLDNAMNLGRTSGRWAVIYAATAVINTSDAREKQQGRPLAQAEQAAATKIKAGLKAFKFNDAVAKKGAEEARWHFGVYAQEVAAAFTSEGLDPHQYALFCYDEWPAQEEQLDADGNVAQAARAAGNLYGIRYEELLAFIIAVL